MVRMAASENINIAQMKQRKNKLDQESKNYAHKIEIIQANEYAKLKAELRV